ncbi:hypothetical protein QBC33DRAFT_526866 [Phialemonium atrogriseum]|uniref:Cytochrome c oxidase subunit 1 n=1 Tax=Phialemonium atrogriseum TaxID=1093897 RepID=A0AAJ0C9H5_9PEZI|nr:uncharacterized protein QBC33DRAFT_526866 [Phialemonium atrogriseum]KAK1771109.1 hypothetical protein QBC33DRAFT_526866 [Phialemonium atrogriseum]
MWLPTGCCLFLLLPGMTRDITCHSSQPIAHLSCLHMLLGPFTIFTISTIFLGGIITGYPYQASAVTTDNISVMTVVFILLWRTFLNE